MGTDFVLIDPRNPDAPIHVSTNDFMGSWQGATLTAVGIGAVLLGIAFVVWDQQIADWFKRVFSVKGIAVPDEEEIPKSPFKDTQEIIDDITEQIRKIDEKKKKESDE